MKGGVDDVEDRMLGDVNLFLYPDPEAESESEGRLYAEVDVMLAEKAERRNGRASAAVKALLVFLLRNLGAILSEYASYTGQGEVELDRLVAKIKDTNEASRLLFGGLGFKQRGGVNYFGEVELALGLEGVLPWEGEDHEEVEYRVS